MKIFDCTTFYNEKILMEARFNILNKHIHKFIVVESIFSHSGNKKKLNFDIKKFIKYKNKIEYLIIDEFPVNTGHWQRENFQRNHIAKGLSTVSEDDYVMISDVDEIPDLSQIKNLDNYKYTAFKQKNLFYKFNLINKTIPDWYGTKICKKKYLKNPQWLRNQKVKKFSIFKFYKIKWNIIEDGGWHFSYLMEPKKIQEKLKAFAHSEYNSEFYTDITRIEKVINNKQDLFERKQEYEIIDIDNSYPSFILSNKDKLLNWIA